MYNHLLTELKVYKRLFLKIDTTLCVKKTHYYYLFLASIKNKNGNFCPEKCQTNSICRTDNLVCPTCQDGWGGPYCYRKFYCHCFFFFSRFFKNNVFTRLIEHFSLNTISYHFLEKHKNST